VATLSELHSLLSDDSLQNKVRGAVLKMAIAVVFEDAGTANHANRLAYAKAALNDVNGAADDIVKYVIGANASSTAAEILALSDSTIQDHVNASLAIFAS